ncbi:MAG: ATP-binding protein [Acidobacteriota bacterium]
MPIGDILVQLPIVVYTASIPSPIDASWISENVEELTGFPASRFVSEPGFWSSRLHTDDLERVRAAFASIAQAGRITMEYRWRVADDSYRWFLDNAVLLAGDPGGPRQVVGTFVEITAQKETESALRESEEHFRNFIEDAVVGIFRTTPDGRILLSNHALQQLLGFASHEELARMNLEEWAREQSYPREAFKAALDRDGVVRGFESCWTRRDGSQIHVRESARAIHDSTGNICYYEGFIEDLTAQKAFEEQVLQMQKMEAVGRLAGGVAHDFNNVLQAMMSLSQLLPTCREDPTHFSEVVGDLQEHVKRGAALARQLLLFARREIRKTERLDLNQVIRQSVRLVRLLLRENVRLVISPADVTLRVDADRAQLEQVIMNLAVNASDAMPEGGVLEVRTERRYHEAVMQVRDNGSGMDEETRARAFEPFFTTKAVGRGTGLGLSVVHGIVTAHGGRVEMESELGKGSLFRVFLPLVEGPDLGAQAPAVRASTISPTARGEHVLVVEDEDGVRESLKQILTVLGYRVTAVESGEKALELPAETRLDLLLTDVALPGVSGPRLAAMMASRRPGLKVIIMSGYTEDAAFREEASDARLVFLQKPFDIETLGREIRKAMGLR